MKYLDDKNRIVEVCRGIQYGYWMVIRCHHRLKTKHLPVTDTKEQCQANLDRYAIQKKWKVYHEKA